MPQCVWYGSGCSGGRDCVCVSQKITWAYWISPFILWVLGNYTRVVQFDTIALPTEPTEIFLMSPTCAFTPSRRSSVGTDS